MHSVNKTNKYCAFLFITWLTLFYGATANVPAQTVSSLEMQVNSPNQCESNISRIFAAHIEAGKDNLIIIIARLGDGERSRDLNYRRLHNFQTFLAKVHGHDPNTMITAEGKRAAGRGRLEVYIKGKLWDVLGLGRGEDLYVGACDGTVKEEARLFYDSRRRRLRK
jgi:hypothetical protein